jgi:hypothetical protein
LRPFALAFPLTLHSLETVTIRGRTTRLATAVVIAQQTGDRADQTDGDDDDVAQSNSKLTCCSTVEREF